MAQIHEAYLAKIEGMELIGKAINANETLQLLENQPVDLLLLDVYMPDQLGTELLGKIREAHNNVDIIMITAAKDKSFLKKAMNYGVQQYLIKPITLERFKEAIGQYKKRKKVLQSVSEVNQEVLDNVFGSSGREAETPDLPPGIDHLTLKKVSEIIKLESEGITSESVGRKLGASRTTARRYLEYLVGIDEAAAEHVYGIVGRPERRYYSKIEEEN